MKTTLLVLLLLVSGLAFSDTSNVKTQEPTTISQPDYKMLYENQKEYNQSVLGTINTALAMFGVACVIVITGSIWFNVVKYNQLKKQIVNKVNEALTTHNHLIDEALERLKNDSLDQFRENTDNNKSAFLANNLSINRILKELGDLKDRINPLDSRVDTLRSEIEQLRKLLREMADKK